MKTADIYVNGKPALKAGIADSFPLRLRGMLLRKFDRFGGLVLTPCAQIHTFFMAYPIDAVYLSRFGEVLRVFPDTVPGRVLPSVESAFCVLELPAGDALRLGISAGGRVRTCFSGSRTVRPENNA